MQLNSFLIVVEITIFFMLRISTTLILTASVRRLFREPRATEAVLDFLRDTRVGRLPGLACFGIMGDGTGRDLELWAEDESSGNEGEEGGGQDPPKGCIFLLSFLCGRNFFPGTQSRRGGAPHHDRASWSGSGKGKKWIKKAAAAMALRAPCNGI